MQKTILILTQENDPHVKPVFEALQHRNAKIIRFDLGDFPERLTLAARIGTHTWQGTITQANQNYALESIQSVWCRRPKQYQASKEYSPPVRVFLNLENYRGFLGVLQDLSMGEQGPFWVSRQNRIQSAEFKPAQLRAAQALGLRVPRTLLTNTPDAVRAFVEECNGKIIIKAVAKGVIDPEDVYGTGQERFMYTSQVLPEHLTDLNGVRVCTHLFQELLPKFMDLRVVVIGKHVFTIGIHAHSEEAALDWRRSYHDLSYSIEQLPNDIEQKLLQLVRRFDLQYSSADLILTPKGEYYFLELNPNGQFYWMEQPTGLLMAEAMANLLCFPSEYCLC